MTVGNVGDHDSEFERICNDDPVRFCRNRGQCRAGTHLHHYPPLRLARPDIIQTHRPVISNTRQDARL